ncbi:MAG: prolyl oligopeptidase family serine peptidase [Woeseiaceae bacterium]|nr:prolyl oligopeptidase family serine peptidase [Woeseiaceae bacterium]
MHSRIILVVAALGCGLSAAAAEGPDLELIMSDPDWLGNAPSESWWSDDAGSVYFEQKRTGEDFDDLYRVPADGGTPERVDAADAARSSNHTRVYNADRSRVAWVHRDDIFMRNVPSGPVVQATRTVATESAPQFMADGRSVAFLRDGAYFVFDPDSGVTAQAADIRFSANPDVEDDFDALRDQQLRNLETLRRDERRSDAEREHEEALQAGDPTGAPLPIYLGDDYAEISRSLSPGGRWLLVVVKEKKAEDGQAGTMPNYVTRSGYLTTQETRTRVGRKVPPAQQLLLVDLRERTFNKLDFAVLPGYDEDPLADLRESALEWHVERGADREKVEEAVKAPGERPLTVDGIRWNDDGSLAAVQLRAIDNKDRWLATLAPRDGELQSQHRLTDAAWINWDYNEFGWLPDGRTLWYLSEESGWSHLYRKSVGERRARQLTRGDFVVREPELDAGGNWFYVVANRTHPGNYEVYRVAAGGGELEQVTTMDGVVGFELSPSGGKLLLNRSWIDRHEDLYAMPVDGSSEPLQLTDTVSDRYKAIDWVIPEIVEVPSSHVDEPIYTKLYLPDDYTPSANQPAVMFVHGAGYTQNAHRGWPYYFREFMFHTLLVNRGYVVIDMDYRASKGYGRDWRTAIYRNMGHPELEDMQDGVQWLVDNYGVDPQRVGVYGGSYGGFMTFMALFREPDLFAAGAALRPVADWMHYNHQYTSNILNTPQVDPVAYERSSPINYVENLEKPLLIAAGMQDDNVFFQDSVLIVQRLLELKKTDFEMAVYPLDPHGFVHPASWLDEYRRILELMEDNLR